MAPATPAATMQACGETMVQGKDGEASHEKRTERAVQTKYWFEHSQETTINAMMLDSQADMLDKEERPEVMRLLGDVKGKDVLELGAGIGRFTGELKVQGAKKVAAVDFMQNLVDENRKTHGHLEGTEFLCADVTELDFPANSVDVVFSNWLLMYLSDEEVKELACKMLLWLRPGGRVFFRESCFQQSGDKKRQENPTHYRNPREYIQIFEDAQARATDGKLSQYRLESVHCVDTYVKYKKNQNQLCFSWRSKETSLSRTPSFRHFLDNQQYKVNGILRYERIFGEGYVSTGGFETTKDFVSMLDLKPGQKVLDVGCGIGGGDFYMAKEFGVSVHGLDLSSNMVTIALERAVKQRCDVRFEISDCTTRDFDENSFDVIYSRDTILHIQDKLTLYQRLLRFLKPGGKLLVSDYCKAPGEPTEQFAAYIAQRGYDLHSVEEYGKILEEAGFKNVVAEDRTWQFKESLERELAIAEADKEGFLREFTAEDFAAVVNGWREKLERVHSNQQKWGLFLAEKPKSS
uniref:phosphoethanolamine N-methyltransferase n=1 Tax=Picocystis salinarum TaxID=88271 RepID=A0A6U9RMU1_9CHLO